MGQSPGRQAGGSTRGGRWRPVFRLFGVAAVFILGAVYGYLVHRNQWWPHPGPDSEHTLTEPLAEAIDPSRQVPPDPGPLETADFLVNGGFDAGSLHGWAVRSSVDDAAFVQGGGRSGGHQLSLYAATPLQVTVTQRPRPTSGVYRLSVQAATDGRFELLELFALDCAGPDSARHLDLAGGDWSPYAIPDLLVTTPLGCEVGMGFESAEGASAALDEVRLERSLDTGAPRFVHPGLLSTDADLAVLAARLQTAPRGPAAAAYARLHSSDLVAPGRRPIPLAEVHVLPSVAGPEESAFKQDALVAYANALVWAIEGDRDRAATAIEFMNAWSEKFERLVSTGMREQAQLEAAWLLPMWANAAELVRHARGGAGWPEADVDRFSAMLDRLQRSLHPRPPRSNWGASTALALIANGVFQDRPEVFDAGVAQWRRLLPEIVDPGGEVNEITRDCSHPQYSLAALSQGAEIAWNQGLDLYATRFPGDAMPRLAIGVEAFAGLLLGEACGSTVPEPGYEIAFNHYAGRRLLALPQLRALLPTRVRPEPPSPLFLGLGTVTHADLATQPE